MTERDERPADLPDDLQRRLRRLIRQWKRHLLLDDEATGHLVDEILGFVRQEVGHLPSRERDDRTAVRRAELIVATATSLDVPSGFIAIACRQAPPGTNATLDGLVRRSLTSARSAEELYADAGFDLVHAWISGGGETPAGLATALRAPVALTGTSWLAYLAARNLGDLAAQQRIVAADLSAGCPASALSHFAATDATEDDVRTALAAADPRQWARQRRWGDLASVAFFMAERGWFRLAHTWSSAVEDDQVPPVLTWDHDQDHHHVLGRLCASSNDATVFAALSLVDLLAGDDERASRRALAGGHPEEPIGPLSWNLAGHFALADWVRSRTTMDLEARRTILEGIDPRHTWLGLLQAQIDSDLADLAATRGDVAQEGELRARAQDDLERPRVDLHFGWFPYDRLLEQLPYPRSAGTAPTPDFPTPAPDR